MAKDAVTAPANSSTDFDPSEWETLQAGLGREWDFDRDGMLVGNFLGTATVETRKVDSGEATAYLFSVGGEDVFVWGSSEIVNVFDRKAPDSDDPIIAVGDRVAIEFLGRDQFTGDDGKPRQIKRYKVRIPKAGHSRS